MVTKLEKLEKKYSILQQKQREMRDQMQESKRALREERINHIIKYIERIGLSIENPAIIIGALIAVKENLDNETTIRYVDLYNEFCVKQQETDITESIAEEKSESEVDYEGGLSEPE